MGTLTQVWFFFTSLIFFILLASFQFAGRSGLFLALVLCTIIIYLTLQKLFAILFYHYQFKKYFPVAGEALSPVLDQHKSSFGFKKIHLFTTEKNLPPLCFKKNSEVAYVALSQSMLNHLNLNEQKELALLLLSHLEGKTYFLPIVLTVLHLNLYRCGLFSTLVTLISKVAPILEKDFYRSDIRYSTSTKLSLFESSFFIFQLQHLVFSRFDLTPFLVHFSILSPHQKSFLKPCFTPNIHSRMNKLIGHTF